MTAFNVCSIIASRNRSRFRKMHLTRYKLYNYSLTFYTFEQHWQIKAASLPSTNIWGSSLVVHSTAHWWLWSSHFLCADPACHGPKFCLWSSQRTYGVRNIQFFKMQSKVMQKSKWIWAKGFFTVLSFFICYDKRLRWSKLLCKADEKMATFNGGAQS